MNSSVLHERTDAVPLPGPLPSSVFVTGGSGFMGRALIDRFRAEGVAARGIDMIADPDRDVIEGDIGDPDGWAAHLEGCEVVIHTAGIVSNNIERARAWEVNVVGTRRVLDAATAAGAKRFVEISTMGVTRFAHADPSAAARVLPGEPLGERWPLMPTGNPYTDTKIVAEHTVLAAHASGRQAVTIIRPADVYGPGCRPWVIEPIAAMRKGRFLLPARGKGLFTPIHIDDLVDGVVRAVAAPAAAGRIVHLGGENPVTTSEYFGHLWRMTGHEGSPPSAPTSVAIVAAETARIVARLRRRHTEVGRGVVLMLTKARGVDNTAAHELLGWWPRVGLDEGMAGVEEWLADTGAGVTDASHWS